MFLGWKICLAGCVVAALAVSLAVSKFVTRFKRDRNKRRALAACEGKADTIFVMLVSYKDAGSAAQTLFSLFSKAVCPLRVYVGLYEFFDDEGEPSRVLRTPATSAVAVFDAMVKKSAAVAFSMQDHVRVLRAPASEFKNAAVAREQVQRFLYRNETFTLCLGRMGCVLLSETWDTYLVSAHGAGALKAKDRAGLSVGMGASSAVLTTVLENSGVEPSIARAGTFVGMGDFYGPFPKLLAYRVKHGVSTNVPVPALAWSASFSFTRGALPYPGHRDTSLSIDTEDMIMTARLLERGSSMWHATKEIACNSVTAASGYNGGHGLWQLPVAPQVSPSPRLSLTSRTPFLDRLLGTLGVDVFTQSVTVRARLGLLPSPNRQAEIHAKIGSAGDLLSLLSRLETKATLRDEEARA